MTRLLAALWLALSVFISAAAHATWGDPDCGFGTAGVATIGPVGTMPQEIVREADGNLLILRVTSSPASSTVMRIGPSGVVLGELPGLANAYGLVSLPSGQILFSVDNAVGRASAAGVLDTTFGSGGYAAIAGFTRFTAPAVQADGRIVVGGFTDRGALARFNADGTPDGTFGVAGIARNAAVGGPYSSIAIQVDGSIQALGGGGITRHLDSGALDTAFGSSGFTVTRSTSFSQGLRRLPTGGALLVDSFSVRGLFGTVRHIEVINPPALVGVLPTIAQSKENNLHPSTAAVPVDVTDDGDILVFGQVNGPMWGVARFSASLVREQSAVLPFEPSVVLGRPSGGFLLAAQNVPEIRGFLGEGDAPTCPLTTTTLVVSPNPAGIGGSVQATVAVTSDAGTPQGLAHLDGELVHLTNGAASVFISHPPGTRNLAATFIPFSPFASSTSNVVVQTVYPSFEVSDAYANLAFGNSSLTFYVTLRVATGTTGSFTVDYATSDGTAKAGVDYTPKAGTLTFTPGNFPLQLIVPISPSLAPLEPSKNLFLTISNPTSPVVLVNATATGVIANIPAGTPTLSIDNASVKEGQSGITLLGFPVKLQQPASAPVSVDYATEDGTAIAGTDYLPTTGTLTFPPGQTRRWVMVPVLGNVTVQPNRTVLLKLSHAPGAVVGDSPGVGTIVDDDPAAAAAPVPVYRFYWDVTKEHLYTADALENDALKGSAWSNENIAFRIFAGSASYGGQYTIPLYRLYHPGIRQHHWTTDYNEVSVLAAQADWQYEGIAGHLLPAAVPGSTPLYRLMYANPPLHLWTTDANEKDVLSTQYGWVYEGVIGEVLP